MTESTTDELNSKRHISQIKNIELLLSGWMPTSTIQAAIYIQICHVMYAGVVRLCKIFELFLDKAGKANYVWHPVVHKDSA